MEERYKHYYKKVPFEYVDVYRVLELFEVIDPALQHAIKKLLVAGGRGNKDKVKDINEAIVSLNRWIDMRKEDDVNNEAIVNKVTEWFNEDLDIKPCINESNSSLDSKSIVGI